MRPRELVTQVDGKWTHDITDLGHPDLESSHTIPRGCLGKDKIFSDQKDKVNAFLIGLNFPHLEKGLTVAEANLIVERNC